MAPQRYLPFIIIAAVAVAAATAGTLIYRAKHARITSMAAQTAADNRGGKPGATPAHAHGPDVAPVTLEEFGDFQCPPCSALAATLKTFEHDYPGKLRVIFRQYPLDMHKHARLAAAAAEAAGWQGKFWEMHEQLYTKQNDWSNAEDLRPILNQYAAAIGLDPARFTADLSSDKTQSRLKVDRERATSLGVNATPTVFINGELVPASMRTTEGLRTAIQNALDGKKIRKSNAAAQAKSAGPKADKLPTILYSVAALLTLVGLADATYLTASHFSGETVTCVGTMGCSDVLGSAYAKIGGIPLAAFGVVAYFTAFSAALLAIFRYQRARGILMLAVGAMFLASLWLLYVQAFILHAFCSYCLLSAALTFALAGIVIIAPPIPRQNA